jgi:hypothetical protein
MIQYLLPHNRRGLSDKLRTYFSYIGRMADKTWFSGGFSRNSRKEEVNLLPGQKTDTIREVLWFIL